MREYFKVENSLIELVNSGRAKKGQDKGKELKALLTEFKTDYKKELSTLFLRNLIQNLTNRQKTFRVAYLLKKANLKTYRKNYYFDNWANQNYKTDVVEYRHKKNGLIYENDCVLSEDETEQLRVINLVKKHNNIDLFNKPLNDLSIRQSRRTAINKEGGVFIKDIRVQNIGNFFKTTEKKTFFMIKA